MNNETLNNAVRICRFLIGEVTTTTDEVINNAVEHVLLLPEFNNLDVNRLKQELQTIYSIQVEPFRILVGRERREQWLSEVKANDNSVWKFWQRYKEYLEEKGFAQDVLRKLDTLTDKILDNLFNPRREHIEIAKKGLVVGQVQSGKTANYTGLICKAADTGFNFIIVLAGIHNNLRSQTQTRLDEGFLGFDTQFERTFNARNDIRIGVGHNPVFRNLVAHSITTSAERGDFTRNGAGIVNFNTSDPILLVVKKNASVLGRLYAWLRTQVPNGANKIDSKSVLIIDDEADNASINTSRDSQLPTRINGLIRDIINIFNRSAYVGYTATPFANIFIAQDDTDLFPRDFIINLRAPSNYIGPEKVFGTSLDNNENQDDTLPIVFKVTDYHNFVPEGHKRGDTRPSFDDIPESLKTAIKCFIVTCAIRKARGQGNKHNSMLIHLSRFMVWQNTIKDLVDELFQYYKREIEANDPSMLEEFRCIFEEDTQEYTSFKTITSRILNSSLSNVDNDLHVHSWDEIRPLLRPTVQKIVVKSINGSSSDVLDYQLNENGISVIAIGGDKLSRGLTLEGLSVSYFLRASKMYDTLMQMGRWFGYRPRYVDLCRLFTSPELNEWFRHITIANEELREEFDYMAESGQTPEEYALKVRQHDGVLQITAINKMRNTREIEVSWAGKLRETYQLPMDRGLKHKNLVATQKLIDKLGVPEQKDVNYLWRNVSPNDICEFFRNFNLAKSLKKLNLELICKYITNLVQHQELTSWSVVLMNKKSSSVKFPLTENLTIGCFNRQRAQEMDDETYFIRKNHILGSPEDEFIDLDQATLDQALQKTKEFMQSQGREWIKNFPAPKIVREQYRDVTNPILIIYPLNPEWANIKDQQGNIVEGTISYEPNDEPFISFAIAFPHSNIRENAVAYRINMIGEYELDEDNFDDENDNTYDEQ